MNKHETLVEKVRAILGDRIIDEDTYDSSKDGKTTNLFINTDEDYDDIVAVNIDDDGFQTIEVDMIEPEEITQLLKAAGLAEYIMFDDEKYGDEDFDDDDDDYFDEDDEDDEPVETKPQPGILSILGISAEKKSISDETIEVEVKPKHFKSATIDMDADASPLAQALKEKFKTDDVTVAHKTVLVNGTGYAVTDFNDESIAEDGSEYTINQLIRRAKNKQGVGSFTVTLRKVEDETEG